jgi:hypothetical protein
MESFANGMRGDLQSFQFTVGDGSYDYCSHEKLVLRRIHGYDFKKIRLERLAHLGLRFFTYTVTKMDYRLLSYTTQNPEKALGSSESIIRMS